MDQYQTLVADVLREGTHKPNRTGVDTVAAFSRHYEVDLDAGFPLLTTKDLGGARWNSLVHELLWYLSGQAHVRDLSEKTGIWDAWADEDGHLDTAYGRFWRRYPVPDEGLPGESWPADDHRWVDEAEGTFDQIQYVLDTLREDPQSRRLVVNAWHPANASVSTLPPCHYTFVCNVQGDRLNVHLTQRSGDVALGVPFNLAAYALLATVLAQRADLEVGTFAHTIVDAHVYCGTGARGDWYAANLDRLQERLAAVEERAGYAEVREWLVGATPADETDGEKPADHVPNLLTQLSRTPRERPSVSVADRPLDELRYADVDLQGYDPAPAIEFRVAE